MKNNLEMIAKIAKIPEYTPANIKAFMKRLDMNERVFALIMNVSPITVKFWITGAAKPCGTAMRLMQLYEKCPDILAFYESEDGQREFAEWKAQREAEKNGSEHQLKNILKS